MAWETAPCQGLRHCYVLRTHWCLRLTQEVSLQVMGGAWIDIRSYMFAQAAGNGHLHIIQWLREQDPPCPWDVMACVRAARSGHLHIIRWLREQDPPCPWDTYPPPYGDCGTVSAAGESGHLHVMRWLYESGFPWEQQYGTQYMQAAAGKGDLKALEWARSQHPPFVMDETVCEASWYMSLGAIGVLEWLRTQDPPCPWTSFTRLYSQRAIFIKEHLTLCGLAGEVAVVITDIVCKIEHQAGYHMLVGCIPPDISGATFEHR